MSSKRSKNSDASPPAENRADAMKQYYAHWFPYTSLSTWLTCRETHSLEETEIALFAGAEMKPVLRSGHFANASEWSAAVKRLGAERVEIGSQTVLDMKRTPLVFDLDDEPYIELVAPSAAVASQSFHPELPRLSLPLWRLMVLSVRILDAYLELVSFSKGDYRPLTVFSGRRGLHLWVVGKYRDEWNQPAVDNLIRRIEALQTLDGAMDFAKLLEKTATEAGETRERLQHLLATLEDFSSKLEIESFKRHLESLARNPETDVRKRARLTVLLKGIETLMAKSDLNEATNGHVLAIILAAPRIDENVLQARDHLIKCPFSVHPATGFVATPLDGLREKASADTIMDDPLRHLVHISSLVGPLSVIRNAQEHFAGLVASFEKAITQ